MTRPQGASLVSKPIAKALGLALVLGIVFAAQIPSAAEAFGVKKSGGTLGGFGAGAWHNGSPNFAGTSGYSGRAFGHIKAPGTVPRSRAPGGDADLRIRSGAYPTITQTARPGFTPGFGVWGGWDRSGQHLTGGGSRPSTAEHGAYMHVIRNTQPPSNSYQESQALRGEAANIKAVIHPAPRGFGWRRGAAPGGPGFDSIRSIGPLPGGHGWDSIGVQGYGNAATTPATYQHIFKNMDRVQ